MKQYICIKDFTPYPALNRNYSFQAGTVYKLKVGTRTFHLKGGYTILKIRLNTYFREL